MDIQPANQTSSTDDQELAKVLAGVNEQIEKDSDAATGLHFEETPPATGAPASSSMPTLPLPPPMPDPSTMPPIPPAGPADFTPPTSPTPIPNSALDDIKKNALNELRPLVDKLNVSAEEKFDTYLLLIRSTDDQSLIGPAYDAAKAITDEARRAQALLDIIKEIDYLSNPHP